MKQDVIFLKVAKDIFSTQFSWALKFLGIMLVINIINIIRAIIQDRGVDNYFNAVLIPANLFMLVIGILSVFFLSHYVDYGVTRKDYFKANLLSSIGLSVIIPILAIGISTVQQFILKNVEAFSFRVADINSVVSEIDSDFIGDIVQSFILTPHVDPESNWILALAVFSLNIFTYYLIGWLISAGFYRFKAEASIGGFGCILIALIILMLQDTLLRIALDLPIISSFATLEFLPLSVSVLGILLLVFISIWIIHSLTKNVVIKM